MNILHVLAQLPYHTGSGVYFCNLIDRLKAYGHRQCAVYAVQGADAFDVLDAKDCCAVPFKTAALPFPAPGMSDVMPYPSTVYGKMDAEMLAAWQAAFSHALHKARKAFQPDVVILHHLWMLTSMGAELFQDATTVGVCHNTDLRQARQNPHLKAAYVTNLAKLDAVAVLSNRQKPAIHALYGLDTAKMTVVGGGFDEHIFYPPPCKSAGRDVRMVYAGKIAASKGVFELVRAFRLAAKAMPELRLEIIGIADTENESRLHALIGDETRITRRPALTQRELAEQLRQKDIFVLPSYFEGIALSAIEALACGLFCVTTEIPDLMELLGDEVNAGGVITYVTPPRVYDTDKAVEEDLDAFVAALAEKLLLQAGKVRRGECFPAGITAAVNRHAWCGVAGRFAAKYLE